MNKFDKIFTFIDRDFLDNCIFKNEQTLLFINFNYNNPIGWINYKEKTYYIKDNILENEIKKLNFKISYSYISNIIYAFSLV